MDNKITRHRLSNLLQYEWIIIAIVTAIIIVAVNMLYVVTAVRLSAGQHFHYFFDENVNNAYEDSFYNLLTKEPPENTFSFDVLEVSGEKLTKNYNLLNTRLTAKEGDAIITDTVPVDYGGYPYRRANLLIDNYRITPVYSFEDLLKDANEYLDRFYVGDALDENSVKVNFEKRTKGDNRFLSEKDKKAGLEKEILRIQKIKSSAALLEKLLDLDDTLSDSEKLFYRYTRYEQSYNIAAEKEKEEYREIYEKEKAEVGERRYGLITSRLTGGELNSGKFFRLTGGGTSDVVIMFFDLLNYQPDLQFEELSFLDTIIGRFSDLK